MQIKKIGWGLVAVFIFALAFFLPGLIAGTSGQHSYEVVFFGDTNLARADGEHNLAKGNDCFSMVALAEACAYKDFGPQRTITIWENGTEYFAGLVQELSKTDLSKAKVILIEQGTNDYNSGVPLTIEEGRDTLGEFGAGRDVSVYTFEGALRQSIKMVRKMAPEARVIVVTPTFCWFPPKEKDCETYMPAGHPLSDYVELEKKIGQECGVEVIDHYDLFEHNSYDNCFEYTIDGLHANEYGRELIAKSIADYINGTEGK